MGKVNLYAIAYSLQQGNGVISYAGSVIHYSEEAAIGGAIKSAREKYPLSEGYSNHQVCVRVIEGDHLPSLLDELSPEEKDDMTQRAQAEGKAVEVLALELIRTGLSKGQSNRSRKSDLRGKLGD